MKQLEVPQKFNRQLPVPNIQDHSELAMLLREMGLFENESDIAEVVNELRSDTGTDQVGVGVRLVREAIKGQYSLVSNVSTRVLANIHYRCDAARRQYTIGICSGLGTVDRGC